MTTTKHWTAVCSQNDLIADSGICALVADTQVALFYVKKQQAVFAIANHDPFSQANVLSRGLIGSKGDDLFVASPVYKQHFCLKTGRCLDDENTRIQAWPARIEQGQVEVLI
ncbi:MULTISPECIES: nitrite reductase small subunit NirD [Amphritea]|uniref:Nitrite reductase (NADH) small subunit n=2 Tax=Amphritea TaxID=515417 RepID=A0A1H9GI47_9GAMM|nr:MULTISPECIES: nitrite reductase small subunit NirD [Amphritea]MBN0987619.1 nitrite reductase small subunit NirD [Amphritea pacifica]MBN1007464.1 nitrite reductase small subunit NirD [Amphritea pacifica]SEQ49754.1 nitrite reductase (NADH) small subunit [Amphritea atlantica]